MRTRAMLHLSSLLELFAFGFKSVRGEGVPRGASRRFGLDFPLTLRIVPHARIGELIK